MLSDFQSRFQIPDLRLLDFELSCAAGVNRVAINAALRQRRTGLVPNNVAHSGLDTLVGGVPALQDFDTPEELNRWQSRNNALALLCLSQPDFARSCRATIGRFGAARVAVVIGSSTASIDRTEEGYRDLLTDGQFKPQFKQACMHNPHTPGAFVADKLGVRGPAMTVSTACSSSAKVFATAARWLANDMIDAVIIGGVDTLCLSVLHGFHALQLVSPQACKPFDADRDGINLGEAAGFAILVHARHAPPESVRLRGFGESSDAHHMSHPHPQGLGAQLAMRAALHMAGLGSDDVDYVNLHGTASKANDFIEGKAMRGVFGERVLASSTKGWTGHTLGAAGITESIIAIDAMLQGYIPGTLNLHQPDSEIPYTVLADNTAAEVRHVMSNSFGFGGNNCSLLFGKD